MVEHVYRHRVRYRETDPMGLVYHAHYVDYFEAARTEMLRELGVAYKDVEASGIIMPVVELRVRYRSPARYDDLLEIRTLVEEPPTTRIRIVYDVRRAGDEATLVTGEVTLCFVDRERGRPVKAPDFILRLFERERVH